MPQTNVEIVERIYEAFANRDVAAALALIDPNIEVEYDGVVLDVVGTYHGHGGMSRLMFSILESFDVESFEIVVEELLEAPDGQIVAALHQHGVGKTSGVSVDIRIAQAWTIENGVAVRWHIFRDLPHALEAHAMER